MGSEQDVTLGEISRTVARIERKVDDQGETITAVNLRLTAIEAKQGDSDGFPPQRSVAKPVMAGTGIGASVLWLAQWVAAHLGKGTP